MIPLVIIWWTFRGDAANSAISAIAARKTGLARTVGRTVRSYPAQQRPGPADGKYSRRPRLHDQRPRDQQASPLTTPPIDLKLVVHNTLPKWRNGRRAGFKIQCPQGRVGSSPTFGIAREPMMFGRLGRTRGFGVGGIELTAVGDMVLFYGLFADEIILAMVSAARLQTRVGDLVFLAPRVPVSPMFQPTL